MGPELVKVRWKGCPQIILGKGLKKINLALIIMFDLCGYNCVHILSVYIHVHIFLADKIIITCVVHSIMLVY